MYFPRQNVLMLLPDETVFPDDLDCTAVGLTVTSHVSDEIKEIVMDDMLILKNDDGIVQTYFDLTRPRASLFLFNPTSAITDHRTASNKSNCVRERLDPLLCQW